jgi:hypothetical protein
MVRGMEVLNSTSKQVISHKGMSLSTNLCADTTCGSPGTPVCPGWGAVSGVGSGAGWGAGVVAGQQRVA